MACPRCDEQRQQQREFCLHCFEIFPRTSRMRRLLAALGLRRRLPSDTFQVVCSVTEAVEVMDPETGSVRRCEDFEALPESLRRAIGVAQSAELDGGGVVVQVADEIRVRDAEGNERVYGSLEELPPELRAALAQAKDGQF